MASNKSSKLRVSSNATLRAGVWLQTKGGKWVDVNLTGTFKDLGGRGAAPVPPPGVTESSCSLDGTIASV
ncbi:MAG: hypothetical protein U0174_21220 [Polyangiaceae bacterium]